MQHNDRTMLGSLSYTIILLWTLLGSSGVAQLPASDPAATTPASSASQVSSEDFLRVVDTINGRAPNATNIPTYSIPDIGHLERSQDGVQTAGAVAYPDLDQVEPLTPNGSVGSGVRGRPTTLEDSPHTMFVPKTGVHHIYAGYDALWFQRAGNDSYPGLGAPLLGNLGVEYSGRYVLGSTKDGESNEFVFAGPFHWQREWDPNRMIDRTDAYTLASTVQRQSSQLSSYESNDVRNVDEWSITKSGWRIIDYNEQLTSIAPSSVSHQRLNVATNNLLIGFHFGGRTYHPITQRISLSTKGMLGGFLNVSRSSFSFTDNGSLISQDRDRGTRLAGLLELGLGANVRLTSRTKLHVGYEMWYIPGMATASNNMPGGLNAGTTIRLRADDDVLFHGTVFGVDARF